VPNRSKRDRVLIRSFHNNHEEKKAASDKRRFGNLGGREAEGPGILASTTRERGTELLEGGDYAT